MSAKKEKRPIKEFSLCTTRLVHAESPARHTCQASVGEFFFLISDARGSNETDRVNFGGSFSLKN